MILNSLLKQSIYNYAAADFLLSLHLVMTNKPLASTFSSDSTITNTILLIWMWHNMVICTHNIHNFLLGNNQEA